MAIGDPFDEARSQRIDAIRSALQQRNPGLMRELLQLARSEYSADEDVQSFQQQLLRLEHASNVAITLIKHGRRKVATGDYDAGIAKIRQALQMEPENRDFQSALFDALTESAKFAVETDAEHAWQFLQEATELSPPESAAGSNSSPHR
jgi:tetratricopeptide (TPR) repeat protein